MSLLTPYFSIIDAQKFQVSAEQGSLFAKNVADDYNPIHDIDNKRFCVPGDLLFALTLSNYGLHEKMQAQFEHLVTRDKILQFSSDIKKNHLLLDGENPILKLGYQGQSEKSAEKVEALIREYVLFSGQNFPHILLPLMQQQGVMFNPKKPLVLYKSMSLQFVSWQFDDVKIALADTHFEHDSKRATAILNFTLHNQANVQIGSGSKTLLLAGLKPFDEQAMSDFTHSYVQRKNIQ